MPSIQFKFGLYIIGHHRSNFIHLGECRINRFFTGKETRAYEVKTILVFNRFFQFKEKMISILKITFLCIIFNFESLGFIVLLQENKKRIFILYGLQSKSMKSM